MTAQSKKWSFFLLLVVGLFISSAEVIADYSETSLNLQAFWTANHGSSLTVNQSQAAFFRTIVDSSSSFNLTIKLIDEQTNRVVRTILHRQEIPAGVGSSYDEILVVSTSELSGNYKVDIQASKVGVESDVDSYLLSLHVNPRNDNDDDGDDDDNGTDGRNHAPVLEVPFDGKRVYVSEEVSFTIKGTDIDRDTLSLAASGLPGGARFTTETYYDRIVGRIVWTPTTEQVGTHYYIDFRLSDGRLVVHKTVHFLVAERAIPEIKVLTDENGQPYGDSVTIDETETLVVQLSTHDADNNLKLLAKVESCLIGSKWLPQWGWVKGLVCNDISLPDEVYSGIRIVDNQLIFTPGYEFVVHTDMERAITLKFQAQVGEVFSNVKELEVEVTDVNRKPHTTNQNVPTHEDTALNFMLSATDADIEDVASLQFTLVSGPTHGTLSRGLPNGRYTPEINYYGEDSFTYRVTDQMGASVVGKVFLTIDAQNDAPIAENDYATTIRFFSVMIPVAANDGDNDGNLVLSSIVIVGQPRQGTVNVNRDGTVEYTPQAGYIGRDVFTYTIKDNDGATSNAAIVFVSVTDHPQPPQSENHAPQANDDVLTTSRNVAGSLNVLGNDNDVDGDTFTVTNYDRTSRNGGIVTCTAQGDCTYVPPVNFVGTDSFTYTITDEHGAVDSATVTITVTASTTGNIPPVANNDTAMTLIHNPVTIDVSANDVDVDGTVVDTTVMILSQPIHGTVTINVDGTITYLPQTNYVGVDLFTYTIRDNLGALSNVATVTIMVTDGTSGNHAPQANDDVLTTSRNVAGSLNVLGNDNDVDSDTFTVTSYDHLSRNDGIVTCTAQGDCTYVPPVNFVGTDSFTYTITDEHGAVDSATVFVTVTAYPVGNIPPVANSQAVIVLENRPASWGLSGSDVDGMIVGSRIVQQPVHGRLSVSGVNVIYTPSYGFIGTDEFRFVLRDDDGAESNIGVITITVIPANDVPYIISVPPDLAVVGELYEYQIVVSDDNSDLTYTLVSGPEGMTMAENGVVHWTPTEIGDYDVILAVRDGEFTLYQRYTIHVRTLLNEVEIMAVHLPEIVSAGEMVVVSVDIENSGFYRFEDALLQVYIPDLGIYASKVLDLQKRDETTPGVYLQLPEEAENGLYLVVVRLTAGSKQVNAYRQINILD